MDVGSVLVWRLSTALCLGQKVMRIQGSSPGSQCLLIKQWEDKPFAGLWSWLFSVVGNALTHYCHLEIYKNSGAAQCVHHSHTRGITYYIQWNCENYNPRRTNDKCTQCELKLKKNICSVKQEPLLGNRQTQKSPNTVCPYVCDS